MAQAEESCKCGSSRTLGALYRSHSECHWLSLCYFYSWHFRIMSSQSCHASCEYGKYRSFSSANTSRNPWSDWAHQETEHAADIPPDLLSGMAQAPNRTRRLVFMSFPCGHKHDLRNSHLHSAALYLLTEAIVSRSLPLYLRSCLWLLGKDMRINFLVMLGAVQRGRHSPLYQKCSGSTASHKPFSLHKMK